MLKFKVVVKRPNSLWTERELESLELGDFLSEVLLEKGISVEITCLGEYEEAKETKVD